MYIQECRVIDELKSFLRRDAQGGGPAQMVEDNERETLLSFLQQHRCAQIVFTERDIRVWISLPAKQRHFIA